MVNRIKSWDLHDKIIFSTLVIYFGGHVTVWFSRRITAWFAG